MREKDKFKIGDIFIFTNRYYFIIGKIIDITEEYHMRWYHYQYIYKAGNKGMDNEFCFSIGSSMFEDAHKVTEEDYKVLNKDKILAELI